MRGKKREAELIGVAREIPRIESCNGFRPSVYCGLEHHVIVGIPQPWAPQEMGLDRFGFPTRSDGESPLSGTACPFAAWPG